MPPSSGSTSATNSHCRCAGPTRRVYRELQTSSTSALGPRDSAPSFHATPPSAQRGTAGPGFTGRVLASTDGWTICALGHRHWGRAGAAGLLLHQDGAQGPEVLLQHRAWWSHHGGTWGTPGGALHFGETPDDGALREVREELGLTAEDVVLGARSVDDHGGWSYTTVLARPARPIEAADLELDGESAGVAWLPLAGLDDVDLHPGLAASLSRLRPLLEDARREPG